MATRVELCRDEDSAWAEFMAAIGSFTAERLEAPGYYPEGWSAKDLLAHVASWAAECGRMLQQIRVGTFATGRADVDSRNALFYEANKDLPLSIVRAESWAARTRMVTVFAELPEVTPSAEEWFVECGAAHYREHLPRLRDWLAESSE